MKKFITASVVLGLTVFVLSAVLGGFALAVAGDIGEQTLPNNLITNKSDFLSKLTIIVNWVFTIFVVIAIIFIILAGIQFVTAGGDAAKVTEARQKLIWAAVGIIVALMARGLPAVVSSIIGGIAITP